MFSFDPDALPVPQTSKRNTSRPHTNIFRNKETDICIPTGTNTHIDTHKLTYTGLEGRRGAKAKPGGGREKGRSWGGVGWGRGEEGRGRVAQGRDRGVGRREGEGWSVVGRGGGGARNG